VARLLLDTTVLIDIERGGSADGLVSKEDEIATAAICIAELLVGAERADAKRRQRREEFIASLVESIPIELYDLRVARAHAALLAETEAKGRPRGAHDLIVAATARARGCEVATLDGRAFDDLYEVKVRAR
jgi:tRNA(fMet)-specific endonuclease VapC